MDKLNDAAMALLREYLLMDERFDFEDWLTRVRNLVEDIDTND